MATPTTPTLTPSRAPTPAMRPVTATDVLTGVAVLLAAVSAAVGLLTPALYRDSDAWVRQARAADLVTLLAVVPTLALGLWKARSGSGFGRVVALAALGYLGYTYAIFGFSVAINLMTPVHIAILGLSVWALLIGAIQVAAHPLDPTVGRRLQRPATAVLLFGVPALFAMLWLGQIAEAISTGSPPAALALAGLTTNPVYALDLAFALPFLVASGVMFARRSAVGAQLALGATLWTALMGVGVMAIFAFDAAAGMTVEIPVVALIAAITLAAIALGVTAMMPPGRRAARRVIGW